MVLAGVVLAGSACTENAADSAKKDVGEVLETTQKGADKAIDATKAAGDKTVNAAQKTVDKTMEIATKVNDGWVTTKLKAKFADEIVLKGSHINVDTTHHVVTLMGTVLSKAGKTRAEEISVGTKHDTRVVNKLVVKAR